MTFDPRAVLARPGLASRTLQGLTPADAYADTTPMACAVSAAGLRKGPEPDAEQSNQLLLGERFDVLETIAGVAWGQARRDGYVGFVDAAALAPPGPPPTHRVAALWAYAFAAPDFKAPALGPYSLNSLVTVEARDHRFLKATGLGWFAAHQLAPVGVFETDYVAVAERFVGAAYLWGGRESSGLDCSGLVQQALFACGAACPRDTDQQQAALGRPLSSFEAASPARGDLLFWPGHVAVVLDPDRILHANAFHMAVVAEPLGEAVARIAATRTGAPTGLRRLTVLA